jgi:sulfite exporter TauE/SafE
VSPGLDYPLAFMTGILGSGHCIGMCGALVSGFFLRASQVRTGPAAYAAYHGARIGVYSLVGALAALLGVALVSTGMLGKLQGLLQILAGLIVILLGLELLGLLRTRLAVGFAPARWLRGMFTRAASAGTVGGSALGGMVNGMMPCALTLSVAVKATTAPSVAEGALLMLTFGLGTLPSMLLVTVLFSRLGTRARGYLLKGAAAVVIVMGLATLYQGIAYFNVMRKLGNW